MEATDVGTDAGDETTLGEDAGDETTLGDDTTFEPTTPRAEVLPSNVESSFESYNGVGFTQEIF